jgi:hypothetical protein
MMLRKGSKRHFQIACKLSGSPVVPAFHAPALRGHGEDDARLLVSGRVTHL